MADLTAAQQAVASRLASGVTYQQLTRAEKDIAIAAAKAGNSLANRPVAQQTTTATPNVPANQISDPAATATGKFDLGLLQALLAANPGDAKIAEAIRLYKAKNYFAGDEAFKQSALYKSKSAAAFENYRLSIEKPEAYRAKIDNEWIPYLRERVVDLGLKVSDAALRAAAEQAFMLGLSVSDTQTMNFIEKAATGIAGGLAQRSKNDLKEFAASMGLYYNSDYFDSRAQKIASGDSTIDAEEEELRNLAKAAYPQFVKQIDAGTTIKDLASPYTYAMANLLEIPQEQVTLDDPMIKRALGAGAQGQMGLWDFEKALKADTRWQYTKNAQSEYANLTKDLMRMFGAGV